jgi:hypothetical protein
MAIIKTEILCGKRESLDKNKKPNGNFTYNLTLHDDNIELDNVTVC